MENLGIGRVKIVDYVLRAGAKDAVRQAFLAMEYMVKEEDIAAFFNNLAGQGFMVERGLGSNSTGAIEAVGITIEAVFGQCDGDDAIAAAHRFLAGLVVSEFHIEKN